ncbi:glycosyltransferase [Flagellimonas lutimaris]|uniref:glycosyltransferase n=1 Tax=Flagellimonas lutimaris TaxID=475082 RepID=UPI003F5CE249
MKKVYFIMPTLGSGGAERVASILLNNLDRGRFSLHLIILFGNRSDDYIKTLKEDVKLHFFEIKKNRHYSLINWVFKLIRFTYKEKPDVLFFGFGAYNVLVSRFIFLFPKGIRFVARETNIPTKHEKRTIIKWLYKCSYKNFDRIIVQSDEMYLDLNENYNIPRNKLFKINNPVDFNYIQNQCREELADELEGTAHNFISVGRLNHQKGYDLLFNELSKLKNGNFRLLLLGNGPDREDLWQMAIELGLEDKVEFVGFVANPYKFMAKADVFILSSRYEGYPNAVLEALSCGTPVMANNCLEDLNQIIRPGLNGDIFSFKLSDFSEKLENLLNSGVDRNRIKDDARERFSIEYNIDKFNEILEF